MQRTKTLLAALFVVFSVALLCWSVRLTKMADNGAQELVPANQAKDAIDFTLPRTGAGPPFHLREQVKGGPVVLDFWATWCGPCREELPHVENLSRNYQGRVAFYGINSSDPTPQVIAFTKQNHLTFPMLSDAKQKVGLLYGAEAIPLLVVVDSHRKVRAVISGYDSSFNADVTISKILDSVLAESKKGS